MFFTTTALWVSLGLLGLLAIYAAAPWIKSWWQSKQQQAFIESLDIEFPSYPNFPWIEAEEGTEFPQQKYLCLVETVSTIDTAYYDKNLRVWLGTSDDRVIEASDGKILRYLPLLNHEGNGIISAEHLE